MKADMSQDSAGITDEERELLDKFAFTEAMKKRKEGDYTPMPKLMEKIKKERGQQFLFGSDRKIETGD